MEPVAPAPFVPALLVPENVFPEPRALRPVQAVVAWRMLPQLKATKMTIV
jgi:hypothetical protein